MLTRTLAALLFTLAMATPAFPGICPLDPWSMAEDNAGNFLDLDLYGVIDVHAHPSKFHKQEIDPEDPHLNAIFDTGLCASSFSATGDHIYTSTGTIDGWQENLHVITALNRVLALTTAGDLNLILDYADLIASCSGEAPPGAILAIEGADALAGDLNQVDTFYSLGVRTMQLVHYRNNELGDIQRLWPDQPPSPYNGGLTPFGAQVVQRMEQLGMVVDVAHTDTQTLMDVLAIATLPVIDSHTGPRDHTDPGSSDRLRTWDELEAIAAGGGVIGVWPSLYGEPGVNRTYDIWADEIVEMKNRLGYEHVALGTDAAGLPATIDGYQTVADLKPLAEALLARGFTVHELRAFFGGNVRRVFQTVLADGNPPDDLSVTVLAEDAQPVDGTAVFARRVFENDPLLAGQVNAALSAPNGAAALPATGGSWQVGLCTQCHATQVNGGAAVLVPGPSKVVTDISIVSPATELTAYYAEAQLTGTVYLDQAKTVPAAHVRVMASATDASDGATLINGELMVSGQTDVSGAFILPVLNGTWEVSAASDSLQLLSGIGTAVVSVPDDNSIDLPADQVLLTDLVLDWPYGHCSDGIENADEDWVDCGGIDCEACPDADGDGLWDPEDSCPWTINHGADDDGDGIDNACDNCPATVSTNLTDSNLDGVGDVCDSFADSDGDGLVDAVEVSLGLDALDPDSDDDGTLDGADPNPGEANANLAWAGIYHTVADDGVTPSDRLSVGIRTNHVSALGPFTVTITGPDLDETLTDADIYSYRPDILSLDRDWPQLDEGLYTITVTDLLGGSVSQSDHHLGAATLPAVDPATIQVRLKPGADSIVSWAPVDAPQTYQYRLRISEGAADGPTIYLGGRDRDCSEEIPAGLLTDGDSYVYQVDVTDTRTFNALFNLREGASQSFSPSVSTYDREQPDIVFAEVYHVIDKTGTKTTAFDTIVNNAEAITEVRVLLPDGVTQLLTTAPNTYTSQPAAATPEGLYTFVFVRPGPEGEIHEYAYDLLTAEEPLPIPDTSRFQVIDLGGDLLRFSWADVATGDDTLYYRVRLQNASTGQKYRSARLNQLSFETSRADILASIGTDDPAQIKWRVEVWDSDNYATVRNYTQSDFVGPPLAILANQLPATGSVTHLVDHDGASRTRYWFEGASPASLVVTLPGGSQVDLLADGDFRYDGFGFGYELIVDGAPATGLYTFLADDGVGSQATVYNVHPATTALPAVDHRSVQVDTLADGTLRITWAAIHSPMRIWYDLVMANADDVNPGPFGEVVVSASAGEGTVVILPQSAIPAGNLMFTLRARDGMTAEAANRMSVSTWSPYNGPGFDYACPVDVDGDGYTDSVDCDADGILDSADNCPGVDNPDQSDSNGNGIGDACDTSDSDGDLMTDSWEYANGLDPADPSDALLDPDGDGATNRQEFVNGTDPLVAEVFDCSSDSTLPTTVNVAWPCGRYGKTKTREVDGLGNIAVDYTVHEPAGPPTGLVVLLQGGNGVANIMGDRDTGELYTSGGNFLVRSAQMFADRGYRAIALDQPNDTFGFDNLLYGQYRASMKHAVDIATVVAAENPEGLDVFLAGTSRGGMSVARNWALGTGIALSSPVTSGTIDYVGDANILPEDVQVPVQYMVHQLDGCSTSDPASAPSVFSRFNNLGTAYQAAGISNLLSPELTGGFVLGGDPCKAYTYHGFLGIETTAVTQITDWMDSLLAAMGGAYPGNRLPTATPINETTSLDQPIDIDLAPAVNDLDGDSLSLTLLYDTSSNGAAVSLIGTTLSYDPTGLAPLTDNLVVGVNDGKGGVARLMVSVTISDPAATDSDGDGVFDAFDNCPATANAGQADANGNGTGDACDPADSDGDRYSDMLEVALGGDPNDPGVLPNETVTVPLQAGWNLLSLPLAKVWHTDPSPPPVNLPNGSISEQVVSIADLFASIAGQYTMVRGYDAAGTHTYNPAAPPFLNTLTYLVGGYGYWINLVEPAQLVLSGPPMLPDDSLMLTAGWNQVGYWGDDVKHVGAAPTYAYPNGAVYTPVASIDEILFNLGGGLELVRGFDALGTYTYNPAAPPFLNTLKYMGPGYSYWIRVTTDSLLRFEPTSPPPGGGGDPNGGGSPDI